MFTLLLFSLLKNVSSFTYSFTLSKPLRLRGFTTLYGMKWFKKYYFRQCDRRITKGICSEIKNTLNGKDFLKIMEDIFGKDSDPRSSMWRIGIMKYQETSVFATDIRLHHWHFFYDNESSVERTLLEEIILQFSIVNTRNAWTVNQIQCVFDLHIKWGFRVHGKDGSLSLSFFILTFPFCPSPSIPHTHTGISILKKHFLGLDILRDLIK